MKHYFLGQEVWQRTGEIFLRQGKIYNGDIKEVQYDRMQTHDYTVGDGFEENEWLWFKRDWSTTDWITDVSSECQT
jgi:hypothetical protein